MVQPYSITNCQTHKSKYLTGALYMKIYKFPIGFEYSKLNPKSFIFQQMGHPYQTS